MAERTKPLTIPAREVRPGDVLFGMTVKKADADLQGSDKHLVHIDFGWDVEGMPRRFFWMVRNQDVTVERPVPSDPIDTVRAEFRDGRCVGTCRKVDDDVWLLDGTENHLTDAEVADFPILWKPGMPIPNTEDAA